MARIQIGLGITFLVAASVMSPAALAQVSADREIHPRSYRQLRLQCRHYIRTPDGVYWNMWGEQEYLQVFNDVVAQKPVKRRRSQGVFIEWVTTGHKWEVEESREKRAWGVPNVRAYRLDDGRVVEMPPPFWDRQIGGTPPLWWSTTANTLPFIYINENERDVVSREQEERATAITAELGGDVFQINLRHGRAGFTPRARSQPSRLEGNIIVHVEDPRRVDREGYLSGEFILWPDPSIEPPPGVNNVRARYRYIAVEDLRPTPEELAEAVDMGDAELIEWKYKRQGKTWRWVRYEIPIRYRDLAALRDRRAARRDVEPEPVDESPPEGATHLLTLLDGDYLYGKLAEQEEDAVRFVVMVGPISAERVFDRSEVANVVELSESREIADR